MSTELIITCVITGVGTTLLTIVSVLFFIKRRRQRNKKQLNECESLDFHDSWLYDLADFDESYDEECRSVENSRTYVRLKRNSVFKRNDESFQLQLGHDVVTVLQTNCLLNVFRKKGEGCWETECTMDEGDIKCIHMSNEEELLVRAFIRGDFKSCFYISYGRRTITLKQTPEAMCYVRAFDSGNHGDKKLIHEGGLCMKLKCFRPENERKIDLMCCVARGNANFTGYEFYQSEESIYMEKIQHMLTAFSLFNERFGDIHYDYHEIFLLIRRATIRVFCMTKYGLELRTSRLQKDAFNRFQLNQEQTSPHLLKRRCFVSLYSDAKKMDLFNAYFTRKGKLQVIPSDSEEVETNILLLNHATGQLKVIYESWVAAHFNLVFHQAVTTYQILRVILKTRKDV